mmetsp:Transcript_39951/g.85217  ORF Transcript_39951/g.85217 Transcript_39951/m.85217 type:complete len:236 (+) Transcript_39951:2401-3108(+)
MIVATMVTSCPPTVAMPSAGSRLAGIATAPPASLAGRSAAIASSALPGRSATMGTPSRMMAAVPIASWRLASANTRVRRSASANGSRGQTPFLVSSAVASVARTRSAASWSWGIALPTWTGTPWLVAWMVGRASPPNRHSPRSVVATSAPRAGKRSKETILGASDARSQIASWRPAAKQWVCHALATSRCVVPRLTYRQGPSTRVASHASTATSASSSWDQRRPSSLAATGGTTT